MIDADALHEAEQEALGQLARMDLAVAARLHQCVLNTDDPKEINDHVRSYQRASRCVRQTIMLRARLRHERERHLLETRPTGRAGFRPLFDDEPDKSKIDPDEMRIDGRILDLQEAASRIMAQTTPRDTPRAERLEQLDRIDAWIDQEVERDEDFGVQPLDDHVLELCRAFNLSEGLGSQFRALPRAPREGDSGKGYNFPPRSQPPRRETG